MKKLFTLLFIFIFSLTIFAESTSILIKITRPTLYEDGSPIPSNLTIKYDIYRGLKPNLLFKKINSTPITSTNYIDKQVPVSKNAYQYYVVSYIYTNNISKIGDIKEINLEDWVK